MSNKKDKNINEKKGHANVPNKDIDIIAKRVENMLDNATERHWWSSGFGWLGTKGCRF